MPNLVQALQTLDSKVIQLNVAAQEIRQLLREISDITGATSEMGHAATSRIGSTQFRDKRIGMAIREYLGIKGGPATKDELLEVLGAGGADLGKFPKRTVANGVAFGVKNGHLDVREGLVYLRKNVG